MRTVVITGGSRGIGAAAVRRFTQEGDRVYFLYEKSRELAEALSQETGAIGLQCDISDEAAVTGAFAQIGPVDVLVNNAGISHIGLLIDMTDNEWDRLLASNLSSAFYCSREALRDMVSAKAGRILNISSMWGTVGASCEAAYSAVKSGMNGLTKALAKEYAPSHIAVNALACGVIDTEMNHQLSSEERAALAEDIPAGRFAVPDEVADLAWQIINSPEYMTGQVIGIDGGYI